MPAPPLSAASPRILLAVADEATPALDHALETARRTGCELHLLHVVVPGSPGTARADGERLLRRLAARAADLSDGEVRISTELAYAGPVAEVIARRAAGAHELVLQCRGQHGPAGVCPQVLCHADCPVVLVPGHRIDSGSIPQPTSLDVSPVLPEALP